MSTPMVFQETAGALRVVVLKGRSLPYQGATWSGTNRVSVAWFPGNPVGVAQVIGATLEPSTFQGKWKDRFLKGDPPGPGFSFGRPPGLPGDERTPLKGETAENAPELRNFPPLAPGGLGLDRGGSTFVAGGGNFPTGNIAVAQHARVVRDAFEALRVAGQLLKVQWGSLVRYGFLTRTAFSHDREEDIAWEMELTWVGVTDAQPDLKEKFKIPDLGILRKLSDLLNKLLGILLEAAFLAARLTQLIKKISSLVNTMLEILGKIAGFIFLPADLIGELRGVVTGIRLAVGDLIRQLASLPAAYRAELGPVEKNTETSFQQAIRAAAVELGRAAVEADIQFSGVDRPDLLGTVIARADTSLRDVSLQFFGTADNWREIRRYNGFAGSVVAAGTIVFVPDLSGGAR